VCSGGQGASRKRCVISALSAVAQNVDDLHSANNKLGPQTSLTERGTVVAGVGFTPNYHDVLTGSQPDGRAFAAGEDRTAATGPRARKAPRWSVTSIAGATRRRRVEVVEVVAPFARLRRRLQPGRPALDRRQRAVLLLRRGLSGGAKKPTMQAKVIETEP
jgi:hypothetical protein